MEGPIFTEEEKELIRQSAEALGMDESAYIKQAVLLMLADHPIQKNRSACSRQSIEWETKELDKVRKAASLMGMRPSKYVKRCAMLEAKVLINPAEGVFVGIVPGLNEEQATALSACFNADEWTLVRQALIRRNVPPAEYIRRAMTAMALDETEWLVDYARG